MLNSGSDFFMIHHNWNFQVYYNKTYQITSEICAEWIFVTFPWWLKNGKSRSKIALFSNERHFEIWFPKKRRITFFWSKLSRLHKKDPILHVATTFFLKQGKTRTSHGPIPHPLTECVSQLIVHFMPNWDQIITKSNFKDDFKLVSNIINQTFNITTCICPKSSKGFKNIALACKIRIAVPSKMRENNTRGIWWNETNELIINDDKK